MEATTMLSIAPAAPEQPTARLATRTLRKSPTSWKLSDMDDDALSATDSEEDDERPSGSARKRARSFWMQKPPRHGNMPTWVQNIVALWQRVLQRDDVSVMSDFFLDLDGTEEQGWDLVEQMQWLGVNISIEQFLSLRKCCVYHSNLEELTHSTWIPTMVRVLVCKNDGAFEFEATELSLADSWTAVKMQLARALYTEEELFAVASPSDISLYKLPEGDDVEVAAEGEPIDSFMTADSRWVLDIFSSPLRRTTDLSLQTESVIRGMRRSSMDGMLGSSPLGNTTDLASSPPTSAIPTTAYHEPYIHIGTWVPMLITDRSRAAASLLNVLKPAANDYEDVLMTTNRAREYISRFRRIGRPVSIISIQTITLPLAIASPSAISQHGARSLYDGVYHLSEGDLQKGFVQAVRLWFSFDCEQTISVTKVNGTLGLKPLRQQDGWIVVQALPGSPAFEAGMRGEEVFLTHVNGVDVSPHAFPSVCDRHAPQISWKDSVIPLVEKTETCIFTFF
ncbi:hypothetical protein P43SY_001530 [Pythium insidiosum]|uniref:PDZ domain-containing protein n=1 Tax=Pythium insidiosum TaxID=114742 RepID=A0AAD5Q9U2_PYTIN|nr:hypothetical protein P43SY_001530 [Pythium insidiosum]